MSWIKSGASAASALVAFVVFAMPAAAQVIYDPLTTQDVVTLLQQKGMEANVESSNEENEGDFVLSKFENINFWIHFTACDPDGTNCELIQFDAGFSFDDDDRPLLEDINTWNEDYFGKAGLDANGDPFVNIEINIVGGVTQKNLADTLSWWELTLQDFTDFIGWD
ncbi:MAG: YbjN domain-containing protein [Hyphomonadaceae bacterium]|nr:YbjN domain-containing protein [Hyphomonadaceae bacterium]